jgi:hypothetical protein
MVLWLFQKLRGKGARERSLSNFNEKLPSSRQNRSEYTFATAL